MLTLFALLYQGRNSSAVKHIRDMKSALDKYEPRNAKLFHRLTQPLARLAGGDIKVAHQTRAPCWLVHAVCILALCCCTATPGLGG